MQFISVVPTNGKGLWSDVSKNVKITDIELSYMNEDNSFGELRLYFDTDTWDTNNDGLIYTDPLFLSEFKILLENEDIDCSDISYSEQGMQGDNFVSFDVGSNFIKSWL